MSIRSRKRIKEVPDVHFNVNKFRVSISLSDKVTNVIAIPGTDLLYQQDITNGQTQSSLSNLGESNIPVFQQIASTKYMGTFFDEEIDIRVNSTNPNLQAIKACIENCRIEILDILRLIKEAAKNLADLKKRLKIKRLWINKLFVSKESISQIEAEIDSLEDYLKYLQKQYEEAKVYISISYDIEISQQYKKLQLAYKNLLNSSKIWNITSEEIFTEHKSSASFSVNRKEVKFGYADLKFISTEETPFRLENADRDNIYIYPTFVLLIAKSGDISITDLSELQFKFHKQRFLEEKDSLPIDADIVGHTWAKVNKDGSRDRRYTENYQIPTVNYGGFNFRFFNQATESYYISNCILAEKFANEFEGYLNFFDKSNRENYSNNNDIFQENDIPKSNRIHNLSDQHDISDEFIMLLRDIARKMLDLKSSLMADKNLNANIAKMNPELKDNSARLIFLFLLHDFSDIFKRISLDKERLETYAASFILNRLLNHDKNDKFNLSNEEIRLNYRSINISKMFDMVIDAGSLLTSLKFSIDQKEHGFKLNTTLILPSLLKSNNISVYEDYKNTFHDFSLLLMKTNLQITGLKESLLKKLLKEMSDPYEITENSANNSITNSNKIYNAFDELNSLIGLQDIKEELSKMINFIKVQNAREKSGLKSTPISYHMVFSGNPGTGKTTVARIISKIYKELGILSEGHLIETDRSGLVAEYVGQTAAKVNNVVDSALNGVLFIDEAYALITGGNNDYGKEAISTLIKRIEDDRDKLVVIFAGYSDEMKKFLDMNPGFQSRINRFLDFRDYSDEELKQIFISQCEKLDYSLTPDALEALSNKLKAVVINKDETFGNARYVRNLFEKTLEQHANRITSEGNLTRESLTTITYKDI